MTTPVDITLKLEVATDELRNEHRLKLNCDYAYTLKYGHVHILCADVYDDTIREVLARHGIAIKSLYTY
ncbi:hypothetical protein G3A43_06510 [Paraburkholderia aspalathi]|nr:hypothetical protein [Paraburkholderia aspalathi]MBK3779901.1 hypothetical protein [Paraburkholderia aspalathi]